VLNFRANEILSSYENKGEVEIKNQMSFDLTIYEGRNRQIKRMMEALGYKVTRLHRKQLGILRVDDLRQGEYRLMKPYEVKQLRTLAEKGKLERKES